MPSARVIGVDLARLLALLGMFAAHLVDENGPGPGDVDAFFQLVAGRSSALFAVLAGVSLAFVSPLAAARRDPGPFRRHLLLRAAGVAFIGLFLGMFSSGIAVILVYYGVLFCCALPVLGWGARRLTWLAIGWGLLSPIVSLLLRGWLPEPTLAVPSFATLLLAPVETATELLVTGYYPVLTWATYLFAGLAVGRALQSQGTRWRLIRTLLLVGAWLATVALAVSALVTRAPGVREALLTGMPLGSWSALARELREGLHGTHPADSWWWLGVWSPHTGSIVDLAHTTGTAVLTLGFCLAAVRLIPTVPWAILSGAGRMTLTFYTAHVLLMASPLGDEGLLARDTATGFPLQAGLTVTLGALVSALGLRGPLESGLSALARTAGPPASGSTEPQGTTHPPR